MRVSVRVPTPFRSEEKVDTAAVVQRPEVAS
jgi:hypothetical protein